MKTFLTILEFWGGLVLLFAFGYLIACIFKINAYFRSE